MNQIREYAKVHFAFLNKYGYILSKVKSDNMVSFVGKTNQMDIIFSMISYEISCQFVDSDNNTFSLQDGLTYKDIQGFRGFYQIANKNEMEKGIIYLGEAVKKLFQEIDISDSLNFQNICQFRIEMHKDSLKKYYAEIDLKKAEVYWKRKEYVKAKELFEKNIEHLSKTQRKMLEYIIKQTR